jgi:hypothetical protein
MNASHHGWRLRSSAQPTSTFFTAHLSKECPMRRFMSACLIAAALIGGSLAMTGCVVVAPRGGYHAGVWVPGYWASGHVWVGGHWR